MELLEMFLGGGNRNNNTQNQGQDMDFDLGDISQIARQFGVTPEKAQEIIKMGLPMILGKLGQNAQDPQAGNSLFETLDRHDGRSFRSLNDVDENEGQKILGHVFGNNNQQQIESEIANTSGVDSKNVKRILSFLAPLALAYLSKRKKQNNMTPDQFRSFGQDMNKGLNEKTGGSLFDVLNNMPDSNQPQQKSGLGGLLGGLLGF